MKTIEQALDEAYKNAGSNAYFGNGFRAGIEFAQRWIQIEEELPILYEQVIVKSPNGGYVCTWLMQDGSFAFNITPTHWRQIDIK